jgi:E3 ubiquitin-protein ligase TRIP12
MLMYRARDGAHDRNAKRERRPPQGHRKRVRTPGFMEGADHKADGSHSDHDATSPRRGVEMDSDDATDAGPPTASSSDGDGGAAGGEGMDEDGDEPGMGSGSTLQSLLRKLGGGSLEQLFSHATNSSKFEAILGGLRSDGDDTTQLQALSELCDLLSMGTEESLANFSVESFVPTLINLLNAEWNPDLMLYACRALTHLMEALPTARRAVVHFGAVDILCAKLLSIEYIDLAEQSLQALGKLAPEHGRALFRAGGLTAVLTYLDFFPTGVQRAAIAMAAAMCRSAPSDHFNMVQDVVPMLTGLLQSHDARTVESACVCFIRLADSFSANSEHLAALAAHGLLSHILQLITGWEGSMDDAGLQIVPSVSHSTYTGLIKLLKTLAHGCAPLRAQLLDMNVANVAAAMLAPDGRSSTPEGLSGSSMISSNPSPSSLNSGSPLLICNSGPQLLEVLSLINALIPATAINAISIDQGLPAQVATPDLAAIKAGTVLGQRLFGLLVSVCTSTQTISVKHASLLALNKLLTLMPAQELKPLSHAQLARFVADLLTANDFVILSGALCMADVLMSKLAGCFRDPFVREGVVHEAERLGKDDRLALLVRGSAVDAETQRLFRTASLRLARAAAEADAEAARASGDNEDEDDDDQNVEAEPLATRTSTREQEHSSSSSSSNATLRRMRLDPQAIFVEQVKSQAQAFRAQHFSEEGSGISTQLLHELRGMAATLAAQANVPCVGVANVRKALDRLAQLMQKPETVSVFELTESGLVGGLASFLGAKVELVETRTRAELLCAAFDAAALQGDAVNQQPPPPPLAIWLEKLHSCIKSQETLPMHLNEIAGGITEGLRLLSRPFKLRLQPLEGETFLADSAPNVVLIEPLATINSVHDFLQNKIREVAALSAPEEGHREPPRARERAQQRSGAAKGGRAAAQTTAAADTKVDSPRLTRSAAAAAKERTESKQQHGDEDTDSDHEAVFSEGQMDEEEDDESVEDIQPSPLLGGAHPQRRSVEPPPPMSLGDSESSHELVFQMHGQTLSKDMTIFRAVQECGHASTDSEHPRSFTPASRAMWSDIFTLHFRRQQTPKAKRQQDAAIEQKSATREPSKVPSLSGQANADSILCMAFARDIGTLQRSRATNSICDLLAILRMSRWLMTPTLRAQLGLSAETVAATVTLDPDLALNATLTAKVLRQLQDPLSLCSGAVPTWLNQLMCTCPFAFPFETKQRYFSCTQLGLSRALSRLQMETIGGGAAGGGRAGTVATERSVSLRIQRQKVRIARTRIVESASKVLDMYGRNHALLEVEFFGEVGTGLGPTLEFYTIVSRELQRHALGLWRASSTDDYVQASEGLFPRPLKLTQRSGGTASRLMEGRSGGRGDPSVAGRFRMLGRLLGKALQDNRLLDIHLSPLLYKMLLVPQCSGSTGSSQSETQARGFVLPKIPISQTLSCLISAYTPALCAFVC